MFFSLKGGVHYGLGFSTRPKVCGYNKLKWLGTLLDGSPEGEHSKLLF
jgi:hypothetical protein